MRYGIYKKMNYRYARHGIPETLIAVIGKGDLESFVAELEKRGYTGHFACNRGHYMELNNKGMEFHIFPYKGPKSPIGDWRTLLK